MNTVNFPNFKYTDFELLSDSELVELTEEELEGISAGEGGFSPSSDLFLPLNKLYNDVVTPIVSIRDFLATTN